MRRACQRPLSSAGPRIWKGRERSYGVRIYRMMLSERHKPDPSEARQPLHKVVGIFVRQLGLDA